MFNCGHWHIQREMDDLRKRAEKAEADRDRLRAALEEIQNILEAGTHENGGRIAERAAIASWCRIALEGKE